MVVTINTDISYSPDYKIGTYAFWIVCNQGKIKKSGRLKQVNNVQDAEAQCIANALCTVYKSKRLENITFIIINTDAKVLISKIGNPALKGAAIYQCNRYLLQIKVKHNINRKVFYKVTHVKAHSGTSTSRQWINDWCDKAAKKELREWVKEIQNTERIKYA